MKNAILSIALFGALGFVGCQSKPCVSYGIAGLSVTSKESVNITDSAIVVVRYQKDGTFTHPIDSFRTVRSYYSYYAVHQLYVDFRTVSSLSLDFDMFVTLYPSKKVYRVTNLFAENGRSKPGFSCVNPIHFTLNGTEMKQMGYIGMGGFELDLPY